jgi:hypothetical protein
MPRRLDLLLALAGCLALRPSAAPAAPSDAEFLLQLPSAHAAALGGAYGAHRASLDDLRCNPAGLEGLSGFNAVIAHKTAPGDWTHEWAAVGGQVGWLSLGGEVLLDSLQPFTLYDANGQATDNASSSSQVLGLAAAVALNRWASAGLEGHLFRSQLYTYEASGLAADLGVNLHWPRQPWSLGLAVQNLGSQSAYVATADPLPLCGRAALQVAWKLDGGLSVRPSVELVGYQDPLRPSELRGGLEATLFDRLDLRGGWMKSGDFDQMSVGLGLHWDQVEVDYAFLPGSDLGDSHVLELKVSRP